MALSLACSIAGSLVRISTSEPARGLHWAKGAFHLSELTGQPIPIVMRISFLIKTNHPDKSNRKYYAQKEMVFQQNLLEKAYFIAKMSGPAMVWLASSDFWKAP